nr:MAG TPA: hypothetical protein [Caudoviricetes sp.]
MIKIRRIQVNISSFRLVCIFYCQCKVFYSIQFCRRTL